MRRSPISLAFTLVASASLLGCNSADDLIREADPASAEGILAAIEPVEISISRETTHITQPLREDGHPDYVAALDQVQGERATASNNYAVELNKVFGPREIKESLREPYFNRLGIRPLPEEGDYFVDFQSHWEQKYPELFEEDPHGDEFWDKHYPENATNQPWRSEDYPELARWHQRYEKHLDQLVPADQHTTYYSPIISESPRSQVILATTGSSSVSHFRQGCRSLLERAMLRLGQGDIEGAWSDALACRRLAHFARQAPTLVDGFVGDALDSLALPAMATIAGHPRLSKEQATRFRRELNSLPARQPALSAMEPGERFSCLDYVCSIVREGPKGLHGLTWVAGGGLSRAFEAMFNSMLDEDAGEDALESMTAEVTAGLTPDEQQLRQMEMLHRAIDWNVVLMTCNAYFDQIQQIGNIEDRDDRSAKLKQLIAEYEELGDFDGLANLPKRLPAEQREEFSRRLAGSLISLMSGSITAYVRSQQRTETHQRLADTALALAIYRINEGEYPERIETLVPGYVRQLPRDGFSDAPLRYTRTPTGYRLWSIGFNRKDEGGRQNHIDGDGDDVTVENANEVANCSGIKPK